MTESTTLNMTQANAENSGRRKSAREADIALWSFLDDLRRNLKGMWDVNKALRFALRNTCEHFMVSDGCLATIHPGSPAQITSVIPRRGQWNPQLLTAFLRNERMRIPRNIILAPITRRGRIWAALGLRR